MMNKPQSEMITSKLEALLDDSRSANDETGEHNADNRDEHREQFRKEKPPITAKIRIEMKRKTLRCYGIAPTGKLPWFLIVCAKAPIALIKHQH
jgi:hypothetical protein